MVVRREGKAVLVGVFSGAFLTVVIFHFGNLKPSYVPGDTRLVPQYDVKQNNERAVQSQPHAEISHNSDPMKSCTDEVLWSEPKVKRLRQSLDTDEAKLAAGIECIYITPNILPVAEISYKMCLHDDINDPSISANLRKGQIYEEKNLKFVARYLEKYPGSGFIDIGANMGIFTLLAAKLGHPVVCVDPRPENLLRLRSALIGELHANEVAVLQNAISNVRTRMHLMTARTQQGNTVVVCKDSCVTTKGGICNNGTVDSIYLDDLIPSVVSLNFQTAILKIDIEGHEARALAASEELFKFVDVRMLVMEWKFFRYTTDPERIRMADNLVNTMRRRQFVPIDPRNDQPLPPDWTQWHVNIAWVKMEGN